MLGKASRSSASASATSFSASPCGAKTFKLKFGHRGANQPVHELETGTVEITSQNHGFAVDETTLPANVKVTHKSLFDGSLQGITCTDRPAFSFQGHPEASPGPRDLVPLFAQFVESMLRKAGTAADAQDGLIAGVLARMPKRTDLESILIIGAGPIVIGQACEFDYSGAQACKALREEGYRVILVNSNPATIMTDPEMADSIYIEPINWRTVARIIEKERPSALLPTMGGQTALNCALDLVREGVLEKYGVELIAASREAIDMAEDRELFRNAMRDIGLECPRSRVAHSLEEALAIQAEIGFPTVIRPSFTLGGSGGGIAYNREEFEQIVARGLDASPTSEVLLEESVIGWKEFEMEVVRDKADNCIIICSIENLDPMGVHTGDSITVAPAQTLTDKEYQLMRDASIAVLRKIGVECGGSNVQFAISPTDGRLLVIEMNPRVSRSSALASKATGFPIAKVAAKLAVGYTLDELRNDITGGATPASFEPTIDYVVTKIPRFTFEKFPGANQRLTTQMKSVGEVMAMGRTFQESLQKALRGLETGIDGLTPICTLPLADDDARNALLEELRMPGPDRLRYVARRVPRRPDAGRGPQGVAHRSVVPGADRGPRARGAGDRGRRQAGAGRAAPARAEAQGLRRQPHREADRRERGRGQHASARARRPPGLQARRHLRRRVRDLDRVHVFDVRGRVRVARRRTSARS